MEYEFAPKISKFSCYPSSEQRTITNYPIFINLQ
nr:MAG TPA: hypothetical protein [Inoviridae sp.]